MDTLKCIQVGRTNRFAVGGLSSYLCSGLTHGWGKGEDMRDEVPVVSARSRSLLALGFPTAS